MFNKLNAAKAFVVASLCAANGAFAGAMADAVTTEVTAAKAEILTVGGIMLGLTGVILLINYVRRAAK